MKRIGTNIEREIVIEVNMNTLLLEIGAEEIPAGYIQPALDALARNLVKRLDEARMRWRSARWRSPPAPAARPGA